MSSDLSVVKTNPQQQEAYGWSARDSSGIFSPISFSRRANGEKDITIKILYCGIDHTDLHYAKDDFGTTKYPFIPGIICFLANIVGEVIEIGAKVTKFKVGDKAGVGGWAESCQNCEYCTQNSEHHCPYAIMTFTINGEYSNKSVVNEHFAVLIPNGMILDRTAPLLCAGITAYTSLMSYGLTRPGMHVDVVGLGGVGHLTIKFAKATGLKVTVISTSLKKRDEALGHFGADSFSFLKILKSLKTREALS